jgi:release factor glutamine methyltransferase
MLDLGVGSGCLLLTLLCECPAATAVGLDISDAALAVARSNAEALGVADRTRLVLGDWRIPGWEQALDGPFDLVVSNPPYIEASAIDGLMPEVGRFEPREALDGGPDGLGAYHRIAAAAHALIVPKGHLVVEAGEGQAPEISRIFGESGLIVGAPWKDLAGIDRVVVAQQ